LRSHAFTKLDGEEAVAEEDTPYKEFDVTVSLNTQIHGRFIQDECKYPGNCCRCYVIV